MKKFLVLTLMMLLGMSLMASDVMISGETMFKFWSDLDEEYLQDGDVEVIFKADVDDYNSILIDLEATGAGPDIVVDEGRFTTEVGKYAGLEDMGVSITVMWGYMEYENAQLASVTEYGKEEVWDFDAEDWAVNIDVGIMDTVHIEYAVSPNPADLSMIVGVYGGVDPVNVEVYYTRERQDGELNDLELADALALGIPEVAAGVGDEDFNGSIGVGANFAMDVMPGMFGFELGANFYYALSEDIETDEDEPGVKYAWGVGLATDILEMAYVDIGAAGWEDAIFAIAFAALGINYQDLVGVDLGVGLTIDPDYWEEVLDEVDVSVWTQVGAAKFRIGWLMHADQSGSVADAFDGAKFGNFFSGLRCPDADLCNPADIENGVVYFEGDLDY
jgi:hypothetical protein